MFIKSVKFLIGVVCGLAFIKWFPLELPFSLNHFLTECILNPLDFFASSISFIIGFLCYASILKEGFVAFVEIIKDKKGQMRLLIIPILSLVSFYLLSTMSVLHTALFFSFSILYGIISLDYYSIREKTVD
ncbi:hypothetical protein [Peribacillus alkalitolerans]|uniref:hypothetical protein n=1 Tax=Peribacillus alkalitolerans TaxID=1550385 RepID=UPI0013CFB276|nr:hypothetical protein [Peribacillus alkalitolerans]